MVHLLVKPADPARAEDRDASDQLEIGQRDDELCDAFLPDLSPVSLRSPWRQVSADPRIACLWVGPFPAVDVQREVEVLAQIGGEEGEAGGGDEGDYYLFFFSTNK